MWQPFHHTVRSPLLSHKEVLCVEQSNSGGNIQELLQRARCSESYHEVQINGLKKSICSLKRKLTIASRQIQEIEDVRGKNGIDLNDELTDKTAQVTNFLADRRSLQSKLHSATAVLISTEARISRMFLQLMSQESDMKFKLEKICALLNKEYSSSSSNEISDSCLGVLLSSNSSPRKGPGIDASQSRCEKFEERFGTSNEEKQSIIKTSNDNMIITLEDLSSTLQKILQDLGASMVSNAGEIKKLQQSIILTNELVASQRQEMNSLRGELIDCRIQCAESSQN
jgi:hypothetical protein